MAYTRTVNFSNKTYLVASTGNENPRVGLMDEVVAAWNDAHALDPARFVNGTFGLRELATPRHTYAVTCGADMDHWTPFVNGFEGAFAPAPVLTARRVLAHFYRDRPYRIRQIDVTIRGYNGRVAVAGNALGPLYELTRIKIRANAQKGEHVCRDLRVLSDFPIYLSQPDDERPEADDDKYVMQIGGEDGDIPLFLEDFEADERIYVTVDWSKISNTNPTYIFNTVGADMWLNKPAVTFHVSEDLR